MLYKSCTHITGSGPRRWAWPDGRSLLEQPSIAVDLFEIFDVALLDEKDQ